MITPSGKIGTVTGLRNYSTDSLVSHVNFSNDYGFTGGTAVDLSATKKDFGTPGGYVSVVSGATATPGNIRLDGSTDYLVTQSAITELQTTTVLTVDAWFNVNSFSSAPRTLVANNSTSTANPGFGIAVVQGSSSSEYYCRGSAVNTTIAALLLNPTTVTGASGQWVNGFFTFEFVSGVGLTYSARFYKPGGLSANQSVLSSAVGFTSNNPLYIGRRATAIQYFDGSIGAVRTYNRLLTVDEMNFNYERSKKRYGH